MLNQLENKRPFPILTHLAAWGVLLALPFFFTGRETETVTLQSYMRFIIVPVSFMFVFYINYFFLVDRYLSSRHPGRFFLSNVIVIIIAMISVHVLMHLLPPPDHAHPPREWEWPEVIGFFLGNAMVYMLVAGLSVAIRMTGGWYKVDSMKKELEKSQTEAELQNLKSQLNPHFLFNTLNNIYSLIAFSPERAQEAVHDLSRLLRYVLYESNHPSVPLEKEVDFIRNYVELMRIRLPRHVDVQTHISAIAPGTQIAPLLFISLIENAFKHGVSNDKPSFIHLDIHQEKEKVVCAIRNSYFPKDTAQDKSGSGIGLINLKKRLALLYPDRYEFRSERKDDYYDTLLVLSVQPLAV